jgi:hypothetical protein
VGQEDDPREQIQAVLKAGSHGHGHGHFDQTNLLSIMRYGRSFYRTQAVLDWKYDEAPEQNGWLKRSANHNMILVDRGNQGFAESGILFTHDGDMLRAAAVQAVAPWLLPDGEATEPMRHRRLMLVTDDYIVVADAVGGAQEQGQHTFDWMIHPVGLQEAEASGKSLVGHDERLADAGACRFITDCDWYDYEGPLCLRFAQRFENDPPNEDGVLMLDVRSAWPHNGRLMLGQYPDGQEEGRQQRCSVSIRTEGSRTRYLTVIEPHEGEPVVAGTSAPCPDELCVELADGRTHEFRIEGLAQPEPCPRVSGREGREGEMREEERTER